MMLSQTGDGSDAMHASCGIGLIEYSPTR